MINHTYTEDSLIVFMHLQKTGGTSLEDLLSNVYKPNYALANPPDIFSRTTMQTKALAGHISFHPNDMAILNNIQKDIYTITLFRDPVQRVLSDYYWIRYYDFEYVVPCRDEGVDVWLRQGFTRGINHMTVFFSGASSEDEATVDAAKSNIENQICMFGLLSDMNGFLGRCASIFGWDEIPEIGNAKQNSHKPLEEMPETIELIEQYNQKDLELYGWIQERHTSLYGE
jgi:hypothetical protein